MVDFIKKFGIKKTQRIIKQYNKIFRFFRLPYGYAPYPLSIIIHVTFRCNHKCLMCNQKDSKVCHAEELPASLYRQRLVELPLGKLYKPPVHLTGGEPLLYGELSDLLKFLHKDGFTTSITTNGSLLKKNAELLVKEGVSQISISIDGLAEVHDTVRNSKNAFKYAIEGIESLAEEKRRFNSTNPKVTVNTCITPLTLHGLIDFVHYIQKMPVDAVNIQHLIFLSKELIDKNRQILKKIYNFESDFMDGYNIANFGDIGFDDVECIINKLKASVSIPLIFSPYFKNSCIQNYYNDINYPFDNFCLFPWLVMRIFSNGDVSPCFGLPLGNIKKVSLFNIWNNRQYRNFRFNLRKHGLYPGCVRCCHRSY